MIVFVKVQHPIIKQAPTVTKAVLSLRHEASRGLSTTRRCPVRTLPWKPPNAD